MKKTKKMIKALGITIGVSIVIFLVFAGIVFVMDLIPAYVGLIVSASTIVGGVFILVYNSLK